MNYKAFFFNFEGLSLKQINKKFFGGWESEFNAKKLITASRI